MPLTLFSATGALRFRPCRLVAYPVLVDPDYSAPSAEPDEIIEPPPHRTAMDSRNGRIRTALMALLIFGVLQAAALAPPLYIVHAIPN